jgi:hypothetical protein
MNASERLGELRDIVRDARALSRSLSPAPQPLPSTVGARGADGFDPGGDRAAAALYASDARADEERATRNIAERLRQGYGRRAEGKKLFDNALRAIEPGAASHPAAAPPPAKAVMVVIKL